jgi:hypothetical protein
LLPQRSQGTACRKTQRLDLAEFERHWPMIERLARALIDRGKFSEAEVGAMLEQVPRLGGAATPRQPKNSGAARASIG